MVNDVIRRVAEKESELRLLRLTGIRTRERLDKVIMIIIMISMMMNMIILNVMMTICL